MIVEKCKRSKEMRGTPNKDTVLCLKVAGTLSHCLFTTASRELAGLHLEGVPIKIVGYIDVYCGCLRVASNDVSMMNLLRRDKV